MLQERLPLEQVAKISKILVCRDPLTNTSRGICYLQFDTLVDSMNVHNSLNTLQPPLTIDEREVGISYCVDGTEVVPQEENGERESRRRSSHKGTNHHHHQQYYNDPNQVGPSLPDSSVDMHSVPSVAVANTYQYTLSDVPRLAEYGAKMYATNAAEHEHYYKYYLEYYTGEIEAGNYANLPLTSQLGGETANSGAAVAQSAMQRKQQQQQGKRQRYDTAAQQKAHWDGESWTCPPGTTVPTITTVAPEPEKKDPVTVHEPEPGRAPDKVRHAKNIVKDMEKWAKQLNQKKSVGGALQLPVPVKEEHPLRPGGALTGNGGADVGFAILEKKENSKLPLTPQMIVRTTASSAIAAASSSKIVAYGSDSDNDGTQEQENGFVANEKDYVDFKKLTCLLCQRAFQSEEILAKHIKMSDLHKQNLVKYKAAKEGTAIGGGGAAAASIIDSDQA